MLARKCPQGMFYVLPLPLEGEKRIDGTRAHMVMDTQTMDKNKSMNDEYNPFQSPTKVQL